MLPLNSARGGSRWNRFCRTANGCDQHDIGDFYTRLQSETALKIDSGLGHPICDDQGFQKSSFPNLSRQPTK
jgi:hypothetical protein